jgi:hypothetical protein
LKKVNSLKELQKLLDSQKIRGYIIPIRYGLLVPDKHRVKDKNDNLNLPDSDKSENVCQVEEPLKAIDIYKKETITIGVYQTED